MPADLMDDLTPPQRDAVQHTDGPLLVFAGPGSGKTRVITRRIAHLVQNGVSPRQILGVTFTNKAACEMAERVEHLLPQQYVQISTFHRFCAQLLRRYGDSVGLESNYTILDHGDQVRLIRTILHELNFDATHYVPDKVAARISRLRNDMVTAEQFAQDCGNGSNGLFDAVVSKVFVEYRRRMLAANSVDFDDLLLHVVLLLDQNPELRRDLDQRYRYILVDEYQDTNMAQYRIVASLSHDYPNLCVTGDPDQSIYAWRGARIENILRFEREFPGARVVRLDQNFRSTRRIVESADRLISHNTQRKHRTLTTDNDEGTPVKLLHFGRSNAESDWIAKEIRRRVESGERNWSDFAVFYRVNALSRQVETALSRQQVPFQVAAGVAFFDRSEVRDMLAYLRLIENPQDEMAFRRIVNVPARHIGRKSIDVLHAFAQSKSVCLLAAARGARSIPGMPKRGAVALAAFAKMIDALAAQPFESTESLLRELLRRIRYTAEVRASNDERDHQRLANVEELLTAANQYDRQARDQASLQGFLETTSLVSDVDGLEESGGCVTLMTLHAAKGLEFPVVVILAVEENLLPHERSVRNGNRNELEEERRLLFVGMTRAREELYLTQAAERTFRGMTRTSIRSSFIPELDATTVDCSFDDFIDDDAYDESCDDFGDFRDFGDDHDVATDSEFGESPASAEDVEPEDDPTDDDRRNNAASHDARAASVKRHGTRSSRRASAEKRQSGRPHPAGAMNLRLTTAAALLNGDDASLDLPRGFAVGMQVRHPHYGRGTVMDVSGMARRRTVTVDFDRDHRRETFVADKCPLQPIGLG